jgi:hypothetical protein
VAGGILAVCLTILRIFAERRTSGFQFTVSMLIRPELIERLADILEGIAVSGASATNAASREATVLVYHAGGAGGGAPVAGESPLLEINLTESDGEASVLVNSALGTVELRGIQEIRLLEATEEVAFYCRDSQRVSVMTLSSRGVIQVYMNIVEALRDMDLAAVADQDLRAAVALKIFDENAEVFTV